MPDVSGALTLGIEYDEHRRGAGSNILEDPQLHVRRVTAKHREIRSVMAGMCAEWPWLPRGNRRGITPNSGHEFPCRGQWDLGTDPAGWKLNHGRYFFAECQTSNVLMIFAVKVSASMHHKDW
jgi:hypothetical protein